MGLRGFGNRCLGRRLNHSTVGTDGRSELAVSGG
jgi:hypothetical protein